MEAFFKLSSTAIGLCIVTSWSSAVSISMLDGHEALMGLCQNDPAKTDPKELQSAFQIIDEFDFSLHKSKGDDDCASVSIMNQTCTLDFKIEKISLILPRLMALENIDNCYWRQMAYLSVLFTPCFCKGVVVSEDCPDYMRKIPEIVTAFC